VATKKVDEQLERVDELRDELNQKQTVSDRYEGTAAHDAARSAQSRSC
jgi:hypothetical protein